MKTTKETVISMFVMIAAITLAGMNSKLSAQEKSKPIKIGTYDSRIVTFAFTRSVLFPELLKKNGVEFDEAEKAKDTAAMDEALYKGLTYQHLLHQRVFSSGSATSITDMIKDKLPEIAAKAGVSILVSKWELTWKDPSVDVIDLTDEVAALFNPKEDIQKTTKEIKNMNPIPLEEMTIGEELELWYKHYNHRYQMGRK